jgi:hypothetical protein
MTNPARHQPKEKLMMLTGLTSLHFRLDPVVTTTTDLFLKPFRIDQHFGGNDIYAMSAAGHWTKRNVTAAAAWWRAVANGTEPEDDRHVWFPGGIAFGRVHPHNNADYGIDIIVQADHDADSPHIEYDCDGRSHVSVDSKTGDSYITIDTTAGEVDKAAAWWERLAVPMRNSW